LDLSIHLEVNKYFGNYFDIVQGQILMRSKIIIAFAKYLHRKVAVYINMSVL